VLFVGKAQRRRRRSGLRSAATPDGASYPWIVRASAMVNQYYITASIATSGLLIKFSSYFLQRKLCINGNEWPNARPPARDRVRSAG